MPADTDSKNTLYLVDISSFIFRAFFAIRNLKNARGEPTNAIYGVLTMLTKLILDRKPEHLVIAYDSKEPSFRKKIYTEYKANRSAPPDDLIPQFDRIEEMVKLLAIPSFRQSGVEADDLIATLTRTWLKEDPEHKVVVVSGDKDLMQLVNDRVVLWDTMKDIIYSDKEVIGKLGVKPSQVRDYLAIVGDSSDNIPGISGIGPKGAVDLLKEHQTLENILRAARAGKVSGKKGELIKTSEDRARLSYELAGLDEKQPIEWNKSKLKFQFVVSDSCLEFFSEMNFKTMVEKYSAFKKKDAATAPSSLLPMEATSLEAIPPAPVPFITVFDEKTLRTCIDEMVKAREFAVDLETTSLNPRQAKIVGVALCSEEARSYYIPIAHRSPGDADTSRQLSYEKVMELLKPVLENAKIKKIGQNLKYDTSVLMQNSIELRGIGGDTMIADYLLDPSMRHGLDFLAKKFFNYKMLTFEDVCGKGKNQIGFDEVSIALATRYSAEDAWVTIKLWRELSRQLNEQRLIEVFARVELPLVHVLGKMECAGVSVDLPWLQKLSIQFAEDLAMIEKKIFAQIAAPINLNSPKQLQKVLFEELKLPTQGKTKTGYSTDASVLDALSDLHEVPRLLLEYREISKLKGTYVDPLPTMIDPTTGKIHAGFHQTVAATGRLSSSDPNLQNIPIRSERGMLIRRAFIASKGCELLSCDYSQIELRLLAHMSDDPVLIDAFLKDEDVHARTASEIFKVPLDRVEDRQRSAAKAINFGLMYGKTVFGLSQELKIPRNEAKDIIERYFVRYKKVREFLDSLIISAQKKGYTETLMGRKREIPELFSKNPAMRGVGERMAMNTPIQGTAADMMKLAMIEVQDQIEKFEWKSRLIIQVHDELVLDCEKSESKKIQTMVIRSMENAYPLKVPLKVNSAVGKNWMDLETLPND